MNASRAKDVPTGTAWPGGLGRTGGPAMVGLLLAVVVAAPADAARPRPRACPDAAYRLLSGPVFPNDPTSDRIRVAGGQVSLGRSCPVTAAVRSKVKAARRYTKVSADWVGCKDAQRVSVRAKIDAVTCEQVEGKLKFRAVVAGVVTTVKVPVLALADVGDSIRIGTFNTQYLPSTVFNKPPDHAEKMAKRIIASGYDWIVLNEVFDDDARDVFADELGPKFPHYIKELDGDTVVAEQSGLAIFSKFPFAPLVNPGCDLEPCGGNCSGPECGNVAFYVYHVCDDSPLPWDVADCDSDKGLALVRIKNPNSGRTYSVLFTHTQASYPSDDDEEDEEEHFATRRDQLGLAGTLLNDHRPAGTAGEDVFLMGDLNVDGNLNNPDLGEIGPSHNRREFEYHFREANDYFQGYFTDPWAEENSPDGHDPGLTNLIHYGNNGARLDFIARHAGTAPVGAGQVRDLCVQHMTRAYNLFWSDNPADYSPKGMGEGGLLSLSDHFGLNADVNRWAPQCRPADAVEVAPPPGTAQLYLGTVTHPGSMQWWKVAEKGTYTIAAVGLSTLTTDDDFELTLYRDTDLSTPVGVYKGETNVMNLDGIQITGSKFDLLEPPYFIRIKHKYRSVTGDYGLAVLRHDCGSKPQSCALRPGEVHEHVLPPFWVGDDEAWFDFETNAIPGGIDPQQLAIRLFDYAPTEAALFMLRVYEDDGSTLLWGPSPTNYTTDDGMSPLPIPEVHHDRTEDQQRKYFLTVGRTGGPATYDAGSQTDFSITWTTNLTILFPGSQGVTVQCSEENDDTSSDDEVYLEWLDHDGTTTAISHEIDDDFEAGEVHSVAGALGVPIYFYDHVTVSLREEDDTSGDDWADFPIYALAPDDPAPRLDETNDRHFDTGGLYILRYSRSHYLPD